jgi:hypothetical protein
MRAVDRSAGPLILYFDSHTYSARVSEQTEQVQLQVERGSGKVDDRRMMLLLLL